MGKLHKIIFLHGRHGGGWGGGECVIFHKICTKNNVNFFIITTHKIIIIHSIYRERKSAREREKAREMHILLFCLLGCPSLPTSLSPLYLLCSFRDTLRDILGISTPPPQSPHPPHTHRDSAQTQRGHTQTHLGIHHRGGSGPRSAHKELSRQRGLGCRRLWCLHHVT
jgi:hypothetical protein